MNLKFFTLIYFQPFYTLPIFLILPNQNDLSRENMVNPWCPHRVCRKLVSVVRWSHYQPGDYQSKHVTSSHSDQPVFHMTGICYTIYNFKMDLAVYHVLCWCAVKTCLSKQADQPSVMRCNAVEMAWTQMEQTCSWNCSCAYFQNLNWNELLMRKVKPPFVPTVVSDVVLYPLWNQ